MNVLIRKKTKKIVNEDIVFAERYIWTYLQTLLDEANFTYEIQSETTKLKVLLATCDKLSLKANLEICEVLVLECSTYIIELDVQLNVNDRITHIYGYYNTGDFTVFFQSFGNTLLECSRCSIDETSIEYGEKSSSTHQWSVKVSKG